MQGNAAGGLGPGGVRMLGKAAKHLLGAPAQPGTSSSNTACTLGTLFPLSAKTYSALKSFLTRQYYYYCHYHKHEHLLEGDGVCVLVDSGAARGARGEQLVLEVLKSACRASSHACGREAVHACMPPGHSRLGSSEGCAARTRHDAGGSAASVSIRGTRIG